MTYADNYNLRSKSAITINEIASAVDGLLTDYVTDGSVASTETTNSTSMVEIADTDASIAAVAGQVVVVIGHITCSNDTAGKAVQARIYRDGVAKSRVANVVENASGAGTAGLAHNLTMVLMEEPGTGTFEYDIRWLVGTSSNGYCTVRELYAFTLRHDAS